MTANASSQNVSPPIPVNDFFLGRQPILGRNHSLFGYELLFRQAAGLARTGTDMSATAAVIAHASHLGMEKVIGDALGFVNVDAEVLMSDLFAFMPRDKIVLEIVDPALATAPVLERIAELAGHGFRFAAGGGIADTPNVDKLLPLVEYVRMDVRDMPLPALLKLVPQFKRENKKLLAEKVETRAAYTSCHELGFDYFQGYYFACPPVISGRKLSPSQLAVMELMALVMSGADNDEIERAVKRDVSLALNLLRLVNTPAVGAPQRIDSLSHAVTILGRRQLQRWLQIMLYAAPSQRGPGVTPLLMLATTRARLLELLAERLRPNQRNVAEVAFTVGIMSLMDVLFGSPMEEIMHQIPVSDEVSTALSQRAGFFGELLRLAECIERMEQMDDHVIPALRELAISSEELVALEMAAFEWSDTVVRYAI